MIIKVFTNTGEEWEDIEVNTLEDLFHYVNCLKERKVDDYYSIKEIKLGYVTEKHSDEIHWHIEIDNENMLDKEDESGDSIKSDYRGYCVSIKCSCGKEKLFNFEETTYVTQCSCGEWYEVTFDGIVRLLKDSRLYRKTE